MRRSYLLLIIVSCCFQAFAQQTKGFFEWESHLPKRLGLNLTQSNEHVYYATNSSIIRIDKEEHAGEFYSKVTGLSEIGISTIAYDKNNELLVIAYTNGNIDLRQENGNIINIPDLFLNTTLIGNKTVNKIFIMPDNRALLACSFGILEINLKTYNSGFTTNFNINVSDITVNGQQIYAATDEGIYTFDLTSGFNPGDPGKWKFLDEKAGLNALYNAKEIETFNNQVYAIIDQDIYVELNDTFKILVADDGEYEFIFLSAVTNKLIIGQLNEPVSRIANINMSGELSDFTTACANVISSAIQDQYDQIWYADKWLTIKMQNGIDGPCSRFDFNSPLTEKSREIRLKGSDVYVGSGGVDENFLFDYNRDGFYARRNGDWINHNGNSEPIINENQMLNFLVAQPHPSKDIVYAGAYPGGVLEINYETGEQMVINSDNSPVFGPAVDIESERVTDIVFDEDENMWVICYTADKPLVVRTKEGIWHTFDFGSYKNLTSITFDDRNRIWGVLSGSSGGVLVFDFNGSLADPTDDQYKTFTSANSALTSNRIYSMAKDLDGDIWVGTQNGPVIFDCGNPFENCTGSVRKVLQDSIAAILLATESITSIAIDGGNRKWFGSSSGIYVQSASGTIQEHRFTSQNSVLFDDNILDVAYDGTKGEIYIATSKGMQSIRIESTTGKNFMADSDVFAYPNPVRPGFSGLIGIQGLATDANVKITNIKGQLVYETQAIGGLATWDGNDLTGSQAASGVYLVFATRTSDIENPNTAVAKIMVIR